MNEIQKLIRLKKLLIINIVCKNSWGKNELKELINDLVDKIILDEKS